MNAPAEQPGSVPMQTVSLKLPRNYHAQMKERAAEAGMLLSDYYVSVIERFISERLPEWDALLAYPATSINISVTAPVPFIHEVRKICFELGFNLQELVMTAVDEHLRGRLMRAA